MLLKKVKPTCQEATRDLGCVPWLELELQEKPTTCTAPFLMPSLQREQAEGLARRWAAGCRSGAPESPRQAHSCLLPRGQEKPQAANLSLGKGAKGVPAS